MIPPATLDGAARSRDEATDVVERFFNRMKNWRGLATRYDKHAVVYGGGVVLAAILDWLKRP
jgi:transposase